MSLRSRICVETRGTGGRDRDPRDAPVVLVEASLDQLLLDELGHHFGDAGRRDPFVLGQAPEGERAVPADAW